jgi:hypothetical protein
MIVICDSKNVVNVAVVAVVASNKRGFGTSCNSCSCVSSKSTVVAAHSHSIAVVSCGYGIVIVVICDDGKNVVIM